MIKIGDRVKWESTDGFDRFSGKVTGDMKKGKRWKIVSKGKTYYVPKDSVTKGIWKKPKPPPKKEEKTGSGKAVLFDRNTGSSTKYKTVDDLVKGLNSKYKQYNFSRLKTYQRMEDAVKAGREGRIEVRKITKEGKQKGKLQVSVSYEKEDGKFQRVIGIFAEKK